MSEQEEAKSGEAINPVSEIERLEKLSRAIRDRLTDPACVLDGEQAAKCEEGLIYALEPVVKTLATLDQGLHPEPAMYKLLKKLRDDVDVDIDVPEPDENGKVVMTFPDQPKKTREMPALKAYEIILGMLIDQAEEAARYAESALNLDPKSERLIEVYTGTLVQVAKLGQAATEVAISQALQIYRQDSSHLYSAISVLRDAADLRKLWEPDQRRIEAVLGAFQALVSSQGD